MATRWREASGHVLCSVGDFWTHCLRVEPIALESSRRAAIRHTLTPCIDAYTDKTPRVAAAEQQACINAVASLSRDAPF
jgi:hypothetical protein